MMSEIVSLEPEPDATNMSMSKPHENESAEIIDFSSSSNELIMGAFFDDLNDVIARGNTGPELALHIERELSRTAEEEISPAKSRLLRLLESADAFGSDEIYDHKIEHDSVFQRLVTTLQATKDRQRSLHDQRRAALKLTSLRAALPEDETRYDEQWQDVIDRLFT